MILADAPAAPDDDCGTFDVGCQLGSFISHTVLKGASDMAASASTMWIGHNSNPTVGTIGADNTVHPDPAIVFVEHALSPFTWGLVVLTILIAGAKVVMLRRTEPVGGALAVIGRTMAAAGPLIAVIALAAPASDAFSVWMVGQATNNFGESFTSMLGVDSYTGALGSVLVVCLVALCAFLVSCWMILVVVALGALLPIFVAFLPIAAAASATDFGRTAYKHLCGWITAFLLFKPTASIVYYFAFKSPVPADAGPTYGPLRAIILLGFAAFGIVKLIKFINPGTAALGLGSVGAGRAIGRGAATGIRHVAAGRAARASSAASRPTGTRGGSTTPATGTASAPGATRTTTPATTPAATRPQTSTSAAPTTTPTARPATQPAPATKPTQPNNPQGKAAQ